MLDSSERKSMPVHMQRSLQVSMYLCQKGFPFLRTRKLREKNNIPVNIHNRHVYINIKMWLSALKMHGITIIWSHLKRNLFACITSVCNLLFFDLQHLQRLICQFSIIKYCQIFRNIFP